MHIRIILPYTPALHGLQAQLDHIAKSHRFSCGKLMRFVNTYKKGGIALADYEKAAGLGLRGAQERQTGASRRTRRDARRASAGRRLRVAVAGRGSGLCQLKISRKELRRRRRRRRRRRGPTPNIAGRERDRSGAVAVGPPELGCVVRRQTAKRRTKDRLKRGPRTEERAQWGESEAERGREGAG